MQVHQLPFQLGEEVSNRFPTSGRNRSGVIFLEQSNCFLTFVESLCNTRRMVIWPAGGREADRFVKCILKFSTAVTAIHRRKNAKKNQQARKPTKLNPPASEITIAAISFIGMILVRWPIQKMKPAQVEICCMQIDLRYHCFSTYPVQRRRVRSC